MKKAKKHKSRLLFFYLKCHALSQKNVIPRAALCVKKQMSCLERESSEIRHLRYILKIRRSPDVFLTKTRDDIEESCLERGTSEIRHLRYILKIRRSLDDCLTQSRDDNLNFLLGGMTIKIFYTKKAPSGKQLRQSFFYLFQVLLFINRPLKFVWSSDYGL